MSALLTYRIDEAALGGVGVTGSERFVDVLQLQQRQHAGNLLDVCHVLQPFGLVTREVVVLLIKRNRQCLLFSNRSCYSSSACFPSEERVRAKKDTSVHVENKQNS